VVNDIYSVHLVNSRLNSSLKFVVCASFRLYSHKLRCSIRSVTHRNTHTHRHTAVFFVELFVNRQTKLIYVKEKKRKREKERTNLLLLSIIKKIRKRQYEVFIHYSIDNNLLEKICS
jgi:hypothetical protein